MLVLLLGFAGTASAVLKDEFCWDELDGVAIHPWYDENSKELVEEIQGQSGSFEKCIETCGRTRTCVGVSWRDESTDPEHMHYGKCFFVRKDGGAHPKVEGFKTALKVRCSEEACWEEKVGMAYNKFLDSSSVETFFSPSSPVNGFQECLDRCTHSNLCKGTTWREEDTDHVHFNKCWFMSKVGKGVKAEGMRSAIRVPCQRREGGSLACGKGTKIDADSDTCVPENKGGDLCDKGTTWVEGVGCQSSQDFGDLLADVKAGKLTGTTTKVDGKTIDECLLNCALAGGEAWAWDTKGQKCVCYTSVKSAKQSFLFGYLNK